MDSVRAIIAIDDVILCSEFVNLIEDNFKDRINVVCAVHALVELEVFCSLHIPDLVIVCADFNGGHGYLTIQRLIDFKSNLKVIAVSDNFLEDVLESLRASGACGYFTFNDNKIVAIDLINKVLQLRSTAMGYEFQSSIQ